jgi:hypothetical protein
MVPRADIVGIEINTPLGELIPAFADAAHSRLPIYRESLDDPVGIAHIKDVLAQLVPVVSEPVSDWSGRRILEDIRRPLLFAPPSMRAIDLLLKMQARRMHLALFSSRLSAISRTSMTTNRRRASFRKEMASGSRMPARRSASSKRLPAMRFSTLAMTMTSIRWAGWCS